MVASGYVPNRGDIVWLSFTPQAGHERAGHRPALVLSPRAYNEQTSLALFCPITSQVKGYPFEVGLPPGGTVSGVVGLPPGGTVSGVVLADQIKSLDWRARRARFECETTSQVIGEVLGKVNVLLE